MIFGIDKSQLSEGGVVRAGAVGGGGGGATLVEGIVGHQVSSVHVSRQLHDKTSFLSTAAQRKLQNDSCAIPIALNRHVRNRAFLSIL
jgi:hypothetical protein